MFPISGNPLSTALALGFVIGILGERVTRYPSTRHSKEATVLPAENTLVVRAANCQIPMAHLSDKLAGFVDEQTKAYENGGTLERALAAEGPSGAKVYAYSSTGDRLFPEGTDQGPEQDQERLTYLESRVWSDASSNSGGWCAYLEDDGSGRLVCEYVYVARARDVFLSSGIRIGCK